MTTTALMFALPMARLRRSPRAYLPALPWAALALGQAAVLRGGSHNRALTSMFSDLALPLGVMALVSVVLGGKSLFAACESAIAFGAPARRVAAAHVGLAVAVAALFSALLGAAVCVLGHGSKDPSLGADLLTTLGVSGLAGAAYGALFAFGSTFGAKGGGRTFVLLGDWLLGRGVALAFVFPRLHVERLLGAPTELEVTPQVSTGILLAMAVGFAVLAVLRASRQTK
jgi:hypothetical protein